MRWPRDAPSLLYFDFLSPAPELVTGFATKFQLYAVTGQQVYGGTRRTLLADVDGLVFVADSQYDSLQQNAESLAELRENLMRSHNRSIDDIPCLLQFNKRDLPHIAPTHYMDAFLNQRTVRLPFFETVATTGEGIAAALNMICRMVIAKFGERKS